MTGADEMTYVAIITLSLPGMEAARQVTVTLSPPDLVAVGDGQVKSLEECTLAELAAFADTLEASLWEAHREQSLRELAAAGNLELEITLLDESGEEPAADSEAAPEPAEDQPMQAGAEAAATGATLEAPGAALERVAGEAATEPSGEAGEETEEESGEVAGPDVEEAAAVEPPVETAATEPAPAAGLPPAAEVPPPPGEDEVAVAGVVPTAVPPEAAPPAPPRRKLRIAGLRRPLGHPTPAAADILVNETAFRDAQAHALSSLDREVAGMLIGPPPEKQPDGRYVVHVSDVIIAKHTKMHGASVTYTPESWRYVTDRLQERYPNEEAVIVGWYHTHPGFGIFLSGMDLFIHQHFFTQKWHIALVLDPHARKSGFFCWDRAQTAVQPYDFPWPEWVASSW
jgi:proteasome lid subunit RPN8/RPN11